MTRTLLLWSCDACGCDYDAGDMVDAIAEAHVDRRTKALVIPCSVCGVTGRFVDGPDAEAAADRITA